MPDPTFMQRLNTPGGYAAIGSVGNAINSYFDSKNYAAYLNQQTGQLKDQIAFQRKIMEEQIALRAQERVRQQMMAQAAGDAFANSLGQYQGFEGQMQSSGNKIADTFMQLLSRQAPNVAPAATGAVADREAGAAALANERSATDAANLAKVQSLAKVFENTGINVNRNNQLGAMLRNFAAGSGQASQGEIAAREGKLWQPDVPKPMPSMMGDLFTGLSSLGVMAANRPQQSSANPYSLVQPGDSFGSVGLKPPSGSGMGLTDSLPRGLGITGPNGLRIVGE